MQKMKFDIKIRPTVLALFVLFTSVFIIITLSLQYYFLKESAISATEDKILNISKNIENKINEQDDKNKNLISYLHLNKNISILPKVKQTHTLLPLMVDILNNNSYTYSLYIGKKNGDFYQLINIAKNEILKKKYKVSSNTKWLIVKIYKLDDKRVKYHEFLDNNLNVLKTTKVDATYDPSIRPWFKESYKSNKVIKTQPYKYTSLQSYGITYAVKIKNKDSVLGLDMSLKSMSSFLKQQLTLVNSEIYLLKNDASIISWARINDKESSNKNYVNDKEKFPYSNKINFKNSNNKFETVNLNNRNYYSYNTKVASSDINEYLSILLPIDIILQPYYTKIYYSSFITLFAMLLCLPLIVFITKLLIQPIQNLAAENYKITQRKFKDVKTVNTKIKELNDLSVSLVELSESIQKHEADQEELMDSFIKLIASAIDTKSKYTGGHCERVPILSMMIAKEASKNKDVFKDFTINNENEEREINVAAWLHDCGKVTTPEYVVDKATKLETIYNRIHEIRTRFEVLHRDLKIKSLENIINGANEKEENSILKKELLLLQKEFEFIASMNRGSEFVKDEDLDYMQEVSKRTWIRNFDNSIGISRDEEQRLKLNKNNCTPMLENLLCDKTEHIIKREYSLDNEYKQYGFKQEVPKNLYNLGECYNLSIKKGTLTNEERYKINEHSIMTIIMLEQLPFMDKLKRVPEFASAHHETLIGTGYPRKLIKEQMSLPSRIIALADVFEALTSSDRPYKDAKTLSESIKILSFMVKDQHLDEDIFILFLQSGIYKQYANIHLEKEQIDNVDISQYINIKEANLNLELEPEIINA